MTLLVPVDQNHGVSTASAQSSRGPVSISGFLEASSGFGFSGFLW